MRGLGDPQDSELTPPFVPSDFLALETMLSREETGPDEFRRDRYADEAHHARPHSGRFSRYIRSAIRRRRDRDQDDDDPPPAPALPTAAHTSV